MTDALTRDFAQSSPADFARVLTRGTAAEVSNILDTLTPVVRSAVVGKLPSHVLVTLLDEELADPITWLASASMDDATAIIGRLPRERALACVNALPNPRQRRRLLQYMNFPSHSVGALVSDVPFRFHVGQAVAEIITSVRNSDSATTQPIALLDGNERYAGVLDLWQLAIFGQAGGLAGDYLRAVEPLRPELAAPDALEHGAWDENVWLPVVDHGSRLLGAVFRAKLVQAVESLAPQSVSPTQNVANIAAGVVTLLGDAVTAVSDRGQRG